MDSKLLLRSLAIGLDDSKTIAQRRKEVYSDIPTEELADSENLRKAEETLKWLSLNKDCGIWWCTDRSYPDYSPVEKRIPYMMFYRGKKPEQKQKRMAVLGTRHCDYYGLQTAYTLGLEASLNGFCVVTGLAEGCDQAATRGALDAFCLTDKAKPVYTLLGCGLEIDYPKFSNELKKRTIRNGGAVISRFLPFEEPLKHHFPDRNVSVAAMSDIVVAVQAPEKSGTLLTCDFALQMGKDVYVSSEGIGENTCRTGSNKLAFEGAGIINSVCELQGYGLKAVRVKTEEEGCLRFGSRYYSIQMKNNNENDNEY